MVRRSRLEILIDMLRVIANGKQKPTHIMYSANLSWLRLNKQLDFLMKQGMIVVVEIKGDKIYRITQKGLGLITYFKKIEGELKYDRNTQVHKAYI